MAFAVAELAFGYLNSSTAFLGSIIIGNGINYAIVLMSRYEEHRARGDGPARRRCAARWAAPGGARWSRRSRASAAYASLMVTSFRGFYQFGVMGAVGALCCWIATYTVLPAMLVAARPAASAGASAPSGRAPLELGWLGALPASDARRRSSIAFARCSASPAVVGLQHFLKDPFEYDFRKLNAKLTTTEEAQQFGQQPGQAVRPLAVADDRAGRPASTRSSRSRRRSGARTTEAPGRPTSSARS